MQWKLKSVKDLRRWHKWFAWKPVQIGNNRVWFESVFRRSTSSSVADPDPDWEYAFDEFEILKITEEETRNTNRVPLAPKDRILKF